MAITPPSTSQYPFLAGGEMGERTRTFDWGQTAIGLPDQWPQSLRATLSILLNTKSPMFLWWGPELIQFYNDAYRPSFGDQGKHPTALGQKGADCWPEIWPTIKPLIDQVLGGGEAIWHEDQLIPIHRNGQLEDVYWTFGYSAVKDESGQPAGVLVICTETTRAVHDRNKLKASETQYRLIFEQAPVAIGTLRGENLIIETANAKLLEILGKPTSIIGQPWLEALPELVGQPAETIIKEVYRSGVPFTVSEFGAQLQKSGQLVQGYYTFSYLPLIENGVTAGILQLAMDVTDQVTARQQLAESEAKLRSVIAQSAVAMGLFMGQDLVIDLVNERMIAYFGQGSSILGKPIREVLTAPADQFALDLLNQVFTTGKAYETAGAPADLTIDGVSGTYYFDISLKPLINASGQVYAILETAVEVTTQVLARLKGEEAEAGLREAVELAQLGTWSIDVATQGLVFSDRLIEWFGYDPSAQSYNEVIPILEAGDQERVNQAVAWALNPESEGVYNEIYTVIHPKTGHKRILHARGKTVFDATGKAVRLNGTAQDITLQREVQKALEEQVQRRTEELANKVRELQETNQLLNRSNDNLQRFAYVASHDLQEPLRKIQQFGDLLKTRYREAADDELTYIQRMQSAASRMSTLIRDLLSYSRISTEHDVATLVSLNEVVQGVLTDLELVIGETGALIQVAPLPAVLGDDSQLGQLFQNLLTNALKFRRVGVAPVVRVDAYSVAATDLPPSVKPVRSASAYYQIDVIDNGIGFDEKYVDRIFEVFQRLHSKGAYTGTGIGLAICEKVAANHGGAITATSQPGQGSTFSIYLPQDYVEVAQRP